MLHCVCMKIPAPTLFTPPLLYSKIWDKALVGIAHSMSGRLGTLPVYDWTEICQLEAKYNTSFKKEQKNWDASWEDMPLILMVRKDTPSLPRIPDMEDAIEGTGYYRVPGEAECVIYDVAKAVKIYAEGDYILKNGKQPESILTLLDDKEYMTQILKKVEDNFVWLDLGEKTPAWIYKCPPRYIINAGERHD